MTSRPVTLSLWLAMSWLALTGGPALAQTKKPAALTLKDLPPAVQKTVPETLDGASVKHIRKETEDGVQQYEIETILSGHARDFSVDTIGTLIVVEEATTIGSIPAAARAALTKKVAGGKLRTVETFQRPGKPLLYEAAYVDAKGRAHEVLLTADGSETKE